jgi:hypothetical protein
MRGYCHSKGIRDAALNVDSCRLIMMQFGLVPDEVKEDRVTKLGCSFIDDNVKIQLSVENTIPDEMTPTCDELVLNTNQHRICACETKELDENYPPNHMVVWGDRIRYYFKNGIAAGANCDIDVAQGGDIALRMELIEDGAKSKVCRASRPGGAHGQWTTESCVLDWPFGVGRPVAIDLLCKEQWRMFVNGEAFPDLTYNRVWGARDASSTNTDHPCGDVKVSLVPQEVGNMAFPISASSENAPEPHPYRLSNLDTFVMEFDMLAIAPFEWGCIRCEYGDEREGGNNVLMGPGRKLCIALPANQPPSECFQYEFTQNQNYSISIVYSSLYKHADLYLSHQLTDRFHFTKAEKNNFQRRLHWCFWIYGHCKLRHLQRKYRAVPHDNRASRVLQREGKLLRLCLQQAGYTANQKSRSTRMRREKM